MDSRAGIASVCQRCRSRAPSSSRRTGLCEVPSPSTASIDRTEKLPIYARELVGHEWLVDPLLQTLELLRLDGFASSDAWRAEAVVQRESFEALSTRLADLWSA